MPNRMIKESIRTSKSVNALTDFQFRVWLYLITYVDDYGRGSADPELLKGLVFPRRKGVTEAQISDALGILANTGMVTLYEYDGEPYFYFPKWGEHQRIQTKKSKFPDPRESTVIHGDPPIETNGKKKPNPKPKEEEKRAPARFSPPTVEEVAAYCRERKNSIDPEAFVDHYTANGWKVGGKSPMKDWKAAVRTWEKNEFSRPAKASRSYGGDHADPAANAKTMEQVKRLREKINGGGA